MKVTMSHHCGSHAHAGSAYATLRHSFNVDFRSREEHIDERLSGRNIVLKYQDLREAYQQEFGQALKDYNEKQVANGRPERQIGDYLQKVSEDKQKNVLYEHIIQFGDRNTVGIGGGSGAHIQAMQDFVKGWDKRNPNMHLVGAVIHRDEHEGTDHLHLFYFPVARDLSRGMEVQNGLKQALQQQGYVTRAKDKGNPEKAHGTAQIIWQAKEKEELERIGREHGLEIEHKHGHEVHLKQQIFKLAQERNNLTAQVLELQDRQKELAEKSYNLPERTGLGKKSYPADQIDREFAKMDAIIKSADKKIENAEHEREQYKEVAGMAIEQRDRFANRYNELKEKQWDKGYLKEQLQEVQRTEHEQMPEHMHNRNHEHDVTFAGR